MVFKFLRRQLDDELGTNALDAVLKSSSNGVALRFGVVGAAEYPLQLTGDADGFVSVGSGAYDSDEFTEVQLDDRIVEQKYQETGCLQWRDEHGCWHTYDDALRIPTKVTEARSTGGSSVSFTVARGLYKSHGQQ